MAQDEQCYSVEAARELITDPRYIVEDFIGSGAMACVYKVSERGTPNIYALKLLREKYRERQQFLDIFQTEAIHMRDLQYPNIVRFYKFVQEETSAYILMDYVEGKPLTAEIQAARTNEQPMPLPKIVRIMAQIARAIAYLHAEGYIHRDIKPGNVLLAGKDEGALLTDLGIAGALDVQDMYGGAGTPSYMPYEQQTHGTIDQTVDSYAFAVMLFEMFTSRKPFIPEKGLNFKEARAAIISLHQSEAIPSIVALRPELPAALDEIFAQALAKKPSERYRDIMDFAQDIHEALLPFLPSELKDFNQIRPQEIIRSAPNAENNATAATQSRSVLIGGLLAIVVISLLVLAGVIFNSRGALSPTSIPNTASVSSIPSTTIPNTNPPATALPASSATPFSPTLLLQDMDAIGTGFGETLSETVQGVLVYAAPFVPLRTVENFYVELTLAHPSRSDYGLAFNFQAATNYTRLRIDPAARTWVLEEINAATETIIQQGALDGLPNRLAMSANANQYRLEIESQLIEYTGASASSSTALYFEDAAPELATLSIGVIGDTAGELPAPLSPISFLQADLSALQATGDASAVVQCPAFVSNYERLERHLANDSTVEAAQTAQSLSAFIYSRCLVEDGAVDFNDSYSDYLAWEDGLRDLVNSLP